MAEAMKTVELEEVAGLNPSVDLGQLKESMEVSKQIRQPRTKHYNLVMPFSRSHGQQENKSTRILRYSR